MSVSESSAARVLRQGFRHLNRWILWLWRLGLGPCLSLAPAVTGRYLVLGHTGRKSGLIHRTPLNYAELGGVVFVVAGFGAASDWYRNIIASPKIELWLPGGRYEARAREVPGEEPARLSLIRAVLRGSGFAAFLGGVNPYSFNDARLARATATYRLIAIVPEKKFTAA
jgi:deazaflavin-dependent oxidoreductase (nitroreductase family)